MPESCSPIVQQILARPLENNGDFLPDFSDLTVKGYISQYVEMINMYIEAAEKERRSFTPWEKAEVLSYVREMLDVLTNEAFNEH